MPTLDELLSDPEKIAGIAPQTAQDLLVCLVCIQPLLIQRALMRTETEVEDDLLTIREVAKRLKISEYRTYQLARQGLIKSIRLGKSVRVKASDLVSYVSQQDR